MRKSFRQVIEIQVWNKHRGQFIWGWTAKSISASVWRRMLRLWSTHGRRWPTTSGSSGGAGPVVDWSHQMRWKSFIPNSMRRRRMNLEKQTLVHSSRWSLKFQHWFRFSSKLETFLLFDLTNVLIPIARVSETFWCFKVDLLYFHFHTISLLGLPSPTQYGRHAQGELSTYGRCKIRRMTVAEPTHPHAATCWQKLCPIPGRCICR